MADEPDWERRISGIAVLDQPLRRDLYRFLGERSGWVGRDEAARALDVARSVAAFHLDKLADAGLLEFRFERTTGRAGPGAGRPAKLYRRAQHELAVSVPDRHYRLAAAILVAAVAEAARTGEAVVPLLRAAAQAAGRRMGEEGGHDDDGTARDRTPALLRALARHGYEPVVTPEDEIAMVNCPFHLLAEQERELVCGMNLDLIEGMLAALGAGDRLTARLQPEADVCCVRVARRGRP